MVAFHIALYGSLVISAPFWLYFLGQFILPALHVRERKFLSLGSGGGCSFSGRVLLTYFILLPLALRASVEYSTLLGFDAYEWRAEEYIGFTCKFMLGNGPRFPVSPRGHALVKLGIRIISNWRISAACHRCLVYSRRYSYGRRSPHPGCHGGSPLPPLRGLHLARLVLGAEKSVVRRRRRGLTGTRPDR